MPKSKVEEKIVKKFLKLNKDFIGQKREININNMPKSNLEVKIKKILNNIFSQKDFTQQTKIYHSKIGGI